MRGGAATSPALVRSPAPTQPRTPAHFSLALLVFACVFVSLVVRVGFTIQLGWCACSCAWCIRHSDLRFARCGQRRLRVCLACALLSMIWWCVN